MRKVLLLFMLILAACSPYTDCKYSEGCISYTEINKMLSSGNDTVQLSIKSIIDADYDSYIVIRPYTKSGWASDSTGVDLTCVGKTGIDIVDNINVLCLIKDHTVVETCELSRGYFDFRCITDIKILDAEKDSLMFFKPLSQRIIIFQKKLCNP